MTSTSTRFILQQIEDKAGFRAESNNEVDGTGTSSPNGAHHIPNARDCGTASTARGLAARDWASSFTFGTLRWGNPDESSVIIFKMG